MPDGTVRLVLVDAAAWTGLCLVVGYAGSRRAEQTLVADTWLTTIRPVEDRGRRWERLAVRRWKGLLPEAGGFFGGRSKKRLAGRQEADAQLVETRRAEVVHWTLAACGPLFLLWNPPAMGAVMVAFGVVFNAPFIVVQRFNRARLLRVVERRERRERRPPTSVGGAG